MHGKATKLKNFNADHGREWRRLITEGSACHVNELSIYSVKISDFLDLIFVLDKLFWQKKEERQY